jgi:glutamate carboxypeptidase
LVFESGRAGDTIVTSRRGSGFALVTAHGRAAHAGNAFQDGINAIWALAKFVDLAQKLNGTIPGTSVSAGLFHGGTARNTVAEHAEAQLDLRFDDLQGQRALFSALQACADTAAAEVRGARLELRPEITRAPLEPSAASRQLLERYAACQRAAGLGASEAARQGGGSDANTVATFHVPVIDGLGPRGRGYHTHDEHVEIATFAPKTEALLRFLLAEFGQSDAE